MRMIVGFKIDIVDISTGKVIYSVTYDKSVTYAGYEFIIRSAGDPVSRPSVIDTLGIGWGAGSTTPFDPSQTALQGVNTSFKAATWIYNPSSDRLKSYFRAEWPAGDPSTELVLIGEIGLFSGTTMVDRTPITPTPKKPTESLIVHGVLGFTESESGFTLL